jgi:hypothetical protein
MGNKSDKFFASNYGKSVSYGKQSASHPMSVWHQNGNVVEHLPRFFRKWKIRAEKKISHT